jgi:hypothetical protein
MCARTMAGCLRTLAASRETMNTPNVMGRALSRWRLLAAVVIIVFALWTLVLFSVGDSRGGEKAWLPLSLSLSLSLRLPLYTLLEPRQTRANGTRSKMRSSPKHTRSDTQKELTCAICQFFVPRVRHVCAMCVPYISLVAHLLAA